MPLLHSFYAWLLAIAAYGTIDLNDYTLLSTNDQGYSFYLDEIGYSSKDNFIVRESIDNHLRAHNVMHWQGSADYLYNAFVIGITSKEGVIIAGIEGEILTGTFQGSQISPLCFIKTLWVDEAYRKQGIGTFLIQKVEHYAYKQGCQMIKLELSEIDHVHDFFKKLGFDDVVMIPSPKKLKGHADYSMEKNLNKDDFLKVELPDKNYEMFIGHPLSADSLFSLFAWNELCNFSKVKRSVVDSITKCIWTDTAQKSVVFIQEKLKNCRKSQDAAHTENEYTIFITSPQGKIIGGTIGEIRSFSNFGNWCYIDSVAINSDYRKRQLGRELFKNIDAYARKKNCRFQQLWTYEWQARGFYEKMGFDVVATYPRSEHQWNQEGYYLRKYLEV